ncbi:Transcriptional regulator, AbiEi antitoxin, Type IV TA system [Micromonospora nigra]|uniref:Transcriptional regulator, AbiEi antitoxin, Type IV TA system n=1 Tax=Micromonospora nigra TaxID=145857 RepID=A0A1C6SGS0_9ACTN|nr:type IV toxin-antitoxin system AbiEi family antitoxin domain-containing protein [Micromonospora nigra]SCL28653.1 Transcriptional regulator, AbiEi antitoxin, Type IV TA system [Micromonospora nigra]
MLLGMLPTTFTYSEALQAGLSEWQLYQLRDQGLIEPVGRGLYRRHDAETADLDLIEVVRRAPPATLCLTSALARHGLTDEIPSRIDVALPRGRHRPSTLAPVAWHSFDPATFEIGRSELPLDSNTSIGLYGPERSIIDAVRLRHREGPELAYAALRRWLRHRDASPSQLLTMARRFPKAERPLREALEILL